MTPPALADSLWALVLHLLKHPFSGVEGLREQIPAARVRCADPEGVPVLLIDVDDSVPLGLVKYRVPVEATAPDVDGMTVHLLLHVLRGKLAELEVFREDGAPVQQLPVPGDLDVF